MSTVVAQPHASRAGLVATIVVSLILNGLLAVIYFNQIGENQKLQSQVTDLTRKYSDAVSDPMLSSPEYASYREQAKPGNLSVVELLSTQEKELATSVLGQPMSGAEARDRVDQANRLANDALKEFGAKADMTPAPGTSLLETLSRWPAVVSQTLGQREQLKKDLASKEDQLKAAESAHRLALAEKDKAIADARAETAKLTERFSAFQQKQSKALEDVQEGASRSVQNLAQQVADLQGQIAQRDHDNEDLKQQMSAVEVALRRFKANPATKDVPIRSPDGEIATVAGTECFINLGRGDQISVGMTFEVYDPNKGIPPLGDGTSTIDRSSRRAGAAGSVASRIMAQYAYDLPVGKGSIEVMSVGPNHTSQCRIIHTEPGQILSQGDLIANLVYDRNIKYNFYVYGDFDVTNGRNGRHPNDIAVIQSLIEQWGGQVQLIADAAKPADSVTPDTSFVVIGRQPQVPDFTAAQQTDPRIKWEIDQAIAKLAAYNAVLEKADKYGVPVLNQDRFLYYTGFYDQAGR